MAKKKSCRPLVDESPRRGGRSVDEKSMKIKIDGDVEEFFFFFYVKNKMKN